MKRIRTKLALLVGSSFTVTFLLVLGLFNWIMMRQIRENAGESVRYLLSENQEEIPRQTLYLSDIMLMDEHYKVISRFVIPVEQEQREEGIALWCSRNREFDRLQYASVSGRKYYLTMIGSVSYEGDREIAVLYVDVTGEMALIRSINLGVLAVAALMGIGASMLGFLTGIQIEGRQAAQKMFFENTSHELKTPLTSIRGYAEGMLTDVIGDHKQAAKVILGETEKMTVLIEDILSCARLESGTVTLKIEAVRPREIIEDCLLPLEGAIQKRGLQVELEIQEGQLKADPDQFGHALNNVLLNAVKYAGSRIVLTYDGKELTVWNDGDCLSDEDLKHIFDRFYTGSMGNTGIGLALTREIINLHGWKIHAGRRDAGIGFTVSFGDRK